MSTILPGKLKQTIKKGMDYSLTLEIEVDGTVLNLTGATVLSKIRADAREESASIDADHDDGLPRSLSSVVVTAIA